MRIILLFSFLLVTLVSHAQRECGSEAYHQFIQSNGRAAQQIFSAESFLPENSSTVSNRTLRTNETSTMTVIRIPVVVHILYHSPAQNISDEQVRSQINALNRDFRRLNADTANTPQHFRSFAADVAIEFELATADPYGGPTNGIVRRQTNVTEWTSDDKIKFSASGGDNAWDSKSYLNIWVGNLRRLMGYSSAPGGPAERDGLVIHTNAFGTINTVAPYHNGRTAVHEAGHWLGLKHIWGDSYCGDDGIADTPKQGNFTPGCPSGIRSSCNNGTNGDMYMNYMDFTYDACINLFTAGQRDRMRAGFLQGGPRYSILSSKGLSAPWTSGRPVTNTESAGFQITLYPNPAASKITIEANDAGNGWIGKEMRIINMKGIIVSRFTINNKKQELQITSLPAGQYMITGEYSGNRFTRTFVKL